MILRFHRALIHRVSIGGLAAPVLLLCLSAAATAGDELKRRGMIGVTLGPVVPHAGPGGGMGGAMAAPLPGAMVNSILAGSAAEEAGLAARDILVKVEDQEIAGLPDFMQKMRRYYGGDTVTLTVRRDQETLTKKLTLRPRPKETSSEFEIAYDSVTSNGKRLRTYLTRPKKEGKSPAVLFIPTPQPQAMEFTGPLAEHPYKKIVDGLTQAGFVTMRLDRQGIGDSEGDNPLAADLQTDVAAYRAAIERLKKYDYVDPTHVFVLASGMGSAIAPLAAEGKAVRGVAAYGSTVVRPAIETMVEVYRRIWKLDLVEDAEIAERATKLEKFLKLCEKPGSLPSEVVKAHPDLKELVAQVAPRDDSIAGVPRAYFYELSKVDYPAAWAKVDAHVLAVWGEADYQAGRADSERIAEAVNRAHSGQATFLALKGIDHNWTESKDAEESYLAGPQGGEFNPVFLEELTQWIRKTSGAS